MKIKKLWLFLLLPIMMSFQCEEENPDDTFHTNLVIQNNSSQDLFLEFSPNPNIDVISSQDSRYIDGFSSTTGFINPSEFEFLQSIRLYTRGDNENLILVYEQSPLVDSLWNINESTTKNVDHLLIISDELLTD